MVNHKNCYSLVFSSSDIHQQLLNSGYLSESWASMYIQALTDFERNHAGMMMWSLYEFRAIHFVSMYLPLRYSAWCKLEGKKNLDTSKLLNEIAHASESALWRSGCVDSYFKQLASKDLVIIDLCFGGKCPLNTSKFDANLFRQWVTSYETALAESDSFWSEREELPKWLCLAVRFASFYIDMWQRQDLDLKKDLKVTNLRKEQSELINRLQYRIMNNQVASMINKWLSLDCTLRDQYALPKITDYRESIDTNPSVRNSSESFLMGE